MRHLLLLLFLLIGIRASAQFSGKGTGTEKDPYLVSCAEELFEVRNDLIAYYKLVSDIDLTTWLNEESPKFGWNPIGSYTKPFKGHFDGNKKSIIGMYINRDAEDCIGFFGCTLDAEIKDLSFVNPIVKGNKYVSILVGRYCYDIENFTSNSISNVSVIAGNLYSHDSECGSIAGCIEPNDMNIRNFTTYKNFAKSVSVKGCYSSADIQSDKEAGGICGRVTCGDFYYYTSGESGTGHYYQLYKVCLMDNSFDGIINAESCAGILAKTTQLYESYHVREYAVTKYLDPNIDIQRNIVTGSLYGDNLVEGISTGIAKTKTLKNNFCLAKILSSINGFAYRISQNGQPDNYAYNKTIINQGGKEILVEDDEQNGYSYGSNTLHRKSTYIGADFDFISQWKIIEGETFPFNINQSIIPIVTRFESGSKGIIEGTSGENGKIFVIINQKLYTTNSIDKSWKLTLGKISEDEVANISFKNDIYHPSVITLAIAKVSNVTPTVLTGDSNSDSVVDAADVVCTTNYILGKPSSSFNEKNADVNIDGQILIDDAVGTVNIIMNEQ